jgi:hypothetical protein
MNPTHTEIPESLKQNLSERDQTPLGKDAWIKVQSISLMPGIAKNYRYLLKREGSLFYAANSGEFPENRSQVFNVELPEEPNRMLSSAEINSIQAELDAVNFYEQPVYQSTHARDGSLLIVTVRKDGQVHEVWYENVQNSLTDLLKSISTGKPSQRTTEEELTDLEKLLKEQQDLAERLKKEPPDEPGTGFMVG